MLHVLLDSNSLTLEDPLASNPERLLLDAARKGQLKLIVPELVVREVMNGWRERALGQRDKVAAQVEKLARFGVAVTSPTAGDIAARGEVTEPVVRPAGCGQEPRVA